MMMENTAPQPLVTDSVLIKPIKVDADDSVKEDKSEEKAGATDITTLDGATDGKTEEVTHTADHTEVDQTHEHCIRE